MKAIFRIVAVVLILTVGVAGLFYMLYVKIGTGYTTEMAFISDYSVSIDAQATFIRQECTVTSDWNGAYLYAVPDGEKVAKDGVIARIFDSDDQIAVSVALEEVTDELDRFMALTEQADQTGVNVEALSRRITQQTTEWAECVRKNQLTGLTDARTALLQTICRQQLLTGEISDFSEKISSLQAEQTQLQSRYVAPVGAVTAPVSGYFVAETDGFESVLTLDMAEEITVDQLDHLQAETIQENEIGKLIQSHVWYAVCKLSAEQARQLTVGNTVYIKVDATGIRLPAEVVKINRDGVESDAVAVLKGTENVEQITDLRQAAVQLELESYHGLKINRDAIHISNVEVRTTQEDGTVVTTEKEVYGVYVIYGEQIKFREVAPIYWGSNYVLCNENAKATGTAAMARQYDQVIIDGKDLYDGKYVG